MNSKLKVCDATLSDEGRSIARIDRMTMDKMGLRIRDTITITGKRSTVAKCYPLFEKDTGKDIIRIDELTRHNADSDGYVIIKKVKAAKAKKVTLYHEGIIDKKYEKYIADALESVPACKGDVVGVPYFPKPLYFEVIRIVPKYGIIAKSTKITCTNERGE